MQKAMSKIGALLLSLFLVLGVTAAMVPAFATEPEDLTSVTVYDRDGRVVTVGKEPGTDTWSALANGQILQSTPVSPQTSMACGIVRLAGSTFPTTVLSNSKMKSGTLKTGK